MTEFLVNFHFLRPWWLLTILPAVIMFYLLLSHQRRSSQWQKIIDEKLLPYLLDGHFSPTKKLPLFALLTLWLIASIGLAGPAWQKIELPVQKEISALMVLWDLSPSMEAEDLKPSRLTRARLKLIDLLDERKEGLTGLIVYSGDAHMVTPLTDDTRTIESQLGGLSPAIMPSRGSNIEKAVQMADQAMLDAGITKGKILILTDGIAENAVSELKSIGRSLPHQVTIWGIGTTQGAPIPLATGGFARSGSGEIVIAKLDEDTLNNAASALSGLYVPFSNDELDIKTILNFSLNDDTHLEQKDKRSFDQWNEQGHWLALILLPFAAFAFRRGWLLCITLMLYLASPPPVYAFGWQDLWQTKDQQAQQKLEQAPEEAAELFNNKDWKAAAQYKAGDFQSAQKHYGQGTSPQDLYNYANTLTQQGDYDNAIANYNKALQQNPDLKEAAENKAIAEQLKQLEQQAQQNQQQNGEGENSEQNQNSQQQQGQNQQGQNQQNQSQQGQQQDGQQNSPEQSGQQQNGDQQGEQQQNQGQKQGDQKQDQQQGQQQAEDNNAQQMQENQASQEQQEAMQQQYAKQQGEENSSDDATEQQAQIMQQAQQEQEQDPQSPEGQQQVMRMTPEMQEQKEAKQALEQWLRKVPDDPSGLLRNKFQYEHNQRQREMTERQLRAPDNAPSERW
ncbi:hypothetical protein TDB9533_01292 [Thalassocella blandensis]|nr:hypothetical protein TDB9533_01292 [Thalassocella blandensis]